MMDRRKQKHMMNRRIKKLRFGMYAHACNDHPGLIVESRPCSADPYGADITVKSLIDGSLCSCSILHCNPQPLSKEEAEFKARLLPVASAAWREKNPEESCHPVRFEFEGLQYVYDVNGLRTC